MSFSLSATRRSILIGALAMLLGILAVTQAAAAHRAASLAPTAKQIAAAGARAERSANLWATVNLCRSANHPTIGIRGQMPALGLTTHLSMKIGVEYYSSGQRRFVPSAATETLDLGRATVGTHQGGARFPFSAPSAGHSWVLRGVIEFRWIRSGRTVARAIRHTRHGQRYVDFGSPPGFSAGTCEITGPPAP